MLAGRQDQGRSREAGDMGRHVHYMYVCPGNMITIQLDDQDDIIELALMIQQLIHECGCCNCEEE